MSKSDDAVKAEDKVEAPAAETATPAKTDSKKPAKKPAAKGKAEGKKPAAKGKADTKKSDKAKAGKAEAKKDAKKPAAKKDGKAKEAKPKKPAVERDQFGFRKGSKKSEAAKLYASKKGATLAEVKEKTGSSQLNLLKELEAAKFKIEKTKVAGAGKKQVTRYKIVVPEKAAAAAGK